MKKKTIFSIVLIVLCVLCTLSVLQVRNVLANHRQNERDDSTDDSFGEDSHDLVLPETPGLAYDYSTEPGRRNYSNSRYKELQERRDEIERMVQELEERQKELEGNAGVTATKNL
jgi:peptidoglycan hydrolase CwlO-like protein